MAPDNRSSFHHGEVLYRPVSVVLPLVRIVGLAEAIGMSDMTQFSVACDGLSNVPVLLVEIEEEVRNIRPFIQPSAAAVASASVVAAAINDFSLSLSSFLDQQEAGLRSDAEKLAQVVSNYQSADSSANNWMNSLFGALGITSISASLGTITGSPDDTIKHNTPDMKDGFKAEAKAAISIYDQTTFSGARAKVEGQANLGGQAFDYGVTGQAGVYSNTKVEAGLQDGNAFFSATRGVGAVLQSNVSVSTMIGGAGAVKLEGANTTTVGATGEGQLKGSVGRNGVSVDAGLKVFLGASTETEVSASYKGIKAGVGVGVSYGLGAHAEAGVSFSTEKIGLKVDLGVAVGLGVSVKFDVSINPSEVYESVASAIDDIAKDIDPWPF